ncbi:L,D-transpeptidase-like protein [Flavobacterium sp. 9]|uniref:murein L,D-transpeptidase catalytic domain-containing protein n=1 Tax=Flavobacterium sp. 9 TaxID=2035198 RepID=UPI000C18A25B|nr:murein L,D-transpeptidase catalytic domain family protein [Flavobacterium sp. 9]PIF30128.1 L,D-transpeptidase-like protein [Flavobacterium sp. 9]
MYYQKKILLLLFIGILFTSFKLINRTEKFVETKVSELNDSSKSSMKDEINAIKKLIKNTHYNNKLCFLIDMRIESGKNRLFIYDFKSDKIIDEGLVAHGLGSETGITGKLKFSNTDNSLCTSLGKYSIGNSYYGKFGKAYKLYGLNKTNSNAYNRNIVLHKYYDVPYKEQEKNICNSYGCPMVNEIFYKRIEKIIDNSEKKIVMDIYY